MRNYYGRIFFTFRGRNHLWTLGLDGQWQFSPDDQELRSAQQMANVRFAVQGASPWRGQTGVSETISLARWLAADHEVVNVKPDWPRHQYDPNAIY